MADMEQMQQAFYNEARELLPELEEALLELEQSPGDPDLVHRVFRALHTLKGSGIMFGFQEVGDLAHELETAFDRVREGRFEADKTLLDAALRGKDHINALLYNPEQVEPGEAQNIRCNLQSVLSEKGIEAEQPASSDHSGQVAGGGSGEDRHVYRIRFKPPRNVFATGTDPLSLVRELNDLGETYVMAHSEDIPWLEDLDPEACHVWWDVLLTTDQGEEAIRDVFIFVEEESELIIEVLDTGLVCEDDDTPSKKLGEILLERGDISQEDLQHALDSQKRLGEILVELGLVSPEQVESALAEQKCGYRAVQQTEETKRESRAESSVRVPAGKLDRLVNLVGELVIGQTRLAQVASEKDDPTLSSISEELERLSDELRDNALGLRMTPIGSSFGKFRRVVRDLSDQKGKAIHMETRGAETELDKTVIEQLSDPLVHLLRNSIDHGIEPPEERRAAGKPEEGTVTLSAEQSGGSVIISISDDGRGMDVEAIRAKAVERGLISESADLPEKQILNLIFEPGFSTSGEITDISGRGVGMDVVKQNIEALRGSVEVKSEPGQGSAITVTLPLTLAIIDGLQVRIGEEYYIVPLNAVQECVELTPEEKRKSRAGRCIPLRESLVPYISLREWFFIRGEPPEIEQVVITQSRDATVGFAVDEVIGQQQTVIKNLGRVYRDVRGISGATIKGDGDIALIIDVDPLIQDVQAVEVEEAE
jgi:two-component system chemotaxis sensor kinase CheA